MDNVVIVFDEASLVLSKNDYVNITQFNRIREKSIFAFFEKYKCFMVLENNKPKVIVYFSPIKLEGRECFEITRIIHELDRTPNLPDELDEFNQATGELIANVFHLLNEAIIADGKTQNEMSHKYYIRNKKTGVYDIYAVQEKVDIAEFVHKLSFVFGID